ncbi:hypothetical protein SynSYN20_01291 [Synechococcus sp. SYN20]|nr:hypothetical protein SynSYN20_01291 [Synechococcus sp. SYN20]
MNHLTCPFYRVGREPVGIAQKLLEHNKEMILGADHMIETSSAGVSTHVAALAG